jgi:hypothetical protein
MLQHCFINARCHETISCLGIFSHTLLRRPDLARKIRTLTMVTTHEDYSTFIKSCKDGQASPNIAMSSVIQHVGSQSVQWRVRVGSWEARLKKGNGHAWAGLVLALSPRLESLDIKRLRRYGLWHLDSWDSRRFGRSPLEKLFGYVSEDASPEGMRLPDLTAIAGLRILKKQKYFGQESINVSKNIPTCT